MLLPTPEPTTRAPLYDDDMPLLWRHWDDALRDLFPLALLWVLMHVVVFRKIWRLRLASRHLRTAVPAALETLRASHDVDAALATMAALGGAMARAVGAALSRLPQSSVAAETTVQQRRAVDLAVLDQSDRTLPILAAIGMCVGGLRFVVNVVSSSPQIVQWASPDQRKLLLAKQIGESMSGMAAALFVAVVCVALHAALEAWRARLRADADHAVALFTAEIDELRPDLSLSEHRLADARQTYRGH